MTRPLLLVEDNEDDIFFMKHAMQKAGITKPLSIVRDGREAIEYLEKAVACDRPQAAIPCLILLDLKLPRVPGLEVLKWIRSHTELQTIPVLVLTSSRQDQDVEQAYRLGANSFFSKPPQNEDLVEMIKVLNDYWLRFCIPPPICVKA